MTGKTKFLIVPAVLLILATLVVKVVWFNSVFLGEKVHDFGFIEVTPPKTVVKHTFRLTNNSGRELVLVDVVPDCGCTTAEAYQEVVAPGEEFVLPVEFKLRQSQLRKSTIRLVFEDGTIEVLSLRGVGKLKDSLRVAPTPIVLLEGEPSRALLGIEQFDDARPQTPKFQLPEGVNIKTKQWKLKSKRKPREEVPANWSMQLELTTEHPITDGTVLEIRVGEASVRVPLTNEAVIPEEVPFSAIPSRELRDSHPKH
ncbi:MAG: DUF1573 domain-containing protein [Phycisphaerales bacterium]|jgi:hypothetical protein|nr:DUF1573 domain-containing protein [Phycisphaerales bacterium]